MRAHTHARNTHWICARVCPYTQSCTRIHVHAMFMCAHIQYAYVWTRTCTLSALNMQAYTHTRIYTRLRTHTHAERTGYVCKCIHERTHAHTGNAYLHARNTYTGYVHASTHAGTYTRVRTHSQATHNANTHAYPIHARSTLCFFWFDFDPLPALRALRSFLRSEKTPYCHKALRWKFSHIWKLRIANSYTNIIDIHECGFLAEFQHDVSK